MKYANYYYILTLLALAKEPNEVVQSCDGNLLQIPTLEDIEEIRGAIPSEKIKKKQLAAMGIWEMYVYFTTSKTKKTPDKTAKVIKQIGNTFSILRDIKLRYQIDGLLLRKESLTSIYHSIRKGNSWLDIATLKLYKHYFFNIDVLEPAHLIVLMRDIAKRSNWVMDYKDVYLMPSDTMAKWRLKIPFDIRLDELYDEVTVNTMVKINALLLSSDNTRGASEMLRSLSSMLASVKATRELFVKDDLDNERKWEELEKKSKIALLDYAKVSLEDLKKGGKTIDGKEVKQLK